MNMAMVKNLVRKDLSQGKWFMLLYAMIGVISACIALIGDEQAFYISMILVVTTLVGVGMHPMFTQVLIEKKENNFSFVMSLPVTHMDYTVAKILSVYIFAAIPWLIIVLATTLVVFSRPAIFDGFVGPAWVMALEVFAAYSVLMAAAMIFSNEAVVVIAVVTCNLFVNFFSMGLFGIESVEVIANDPNFGWNQTLTNIVLAEILFMVAVIGLTCFVQSRKRDLI